MSKPTKTDDELIAMAKVELKVHADCPDGIVISVIPRAHLGISRRGRPATVAKPGYPECVAMLVQVGDHLAKQYDVRREVRGRTGRVIASWDRVARMRAR